MASVFHRVVTISVKGFPVNVFSVNEFFVRGFSGNGFSVNRFSINGSITDSAKESGGIYC